MPTTSVEVAPRPTALTLTLSQRERGLDAMTPADDDIARQEQGPADDGEGGYRLVGWDEKGPIEPAASLGPPSGTSVPAVSAGETPAPQGETPVPQGGKPEPQGETPEPDHRPPMPRTPFLTGTFSFPLSAGAWVHALSLALGALMVLKLAARSLGLGDSPEPQSWVLSALLGAMAVILAVMWFTYASACALAVVRDTANGLTKVTAWPGWSFLDYLIEPLYLFNGGTSRACCRALPWGGCWPVAACRAERRRRPARCWCCFRSCFCRCSKRARRSRPSRKRCARTLVVAARGWAAFYLTSAMSLVIGAAVAAIGQWIGGLWGTAVTAVALAVGWLIYFRLLGRLAWYCADRTAVAEPEDEPEDEAAEELQVKEVPMVPVTFVFCPRCGKRVEIGRVPVGAEVDCAGCGGRFALQFKA